MSDVLARVRVKETHGIRRFLYPLSASIPLPASADIGKIGLADASGLAVPMRLVAEDETDRADSYRLDFAVFLEPLSESELTLSYGGLHTPIDDPLQISRSASQGWQSVQKRFRLETDTDDAIDRVLYDGVEHLRGRLSITRNGAAMLVGTRNATYTGLRFVAVSDGHYKDGCAGRTTLDLTACKSWALVTHRLENAGAYEAVDFTLPFALTSHTPTYDLGAGNGIYGKLPEEVIWHTVLGGESYARWSVTVDERRDYVGATPTEKDGQAQRWFHLIDGEKALAVAITQVPPACKHLAVVLKADGQVRVSYELEGNPSPRAEFGVCYHFLNGIPAIAAATNPPSILLPPTVDVLPA